ncbi:MAG: glycosyltransferase, partial [Muribaculaceae bacterium]|nr:glycosyltransferase [Muribaculaceae bacterium]
MRVTHVIFNFCTGGTETMLIDIMRSQLSLGASVSLVIINNNNEQALVDTIPPGVKLVMIGRPEGSKNPWYILKYNMALRRLRPDVIHIHTVKAAGMILGRPAPLGLTVHCCGARLSYLDRYSRVWAISQAVCDDVMGRYSCDSAIVYNGIDTSSVSVAASHDERPNPLKIVQIGRLEPQIKGQDLLLQALALLNEKDDAPKVEVTFIGAGGGREALET